MIQAVVFGFHAGKWREGIKTALYIKDISPECIAEYEASDKQCSTPSPSKSRSAYVSAFDLSTLDSIIKFRSARTMYGNHILKLISKKRPNSLMVDSVTNSLGISITVGSVVVYKHKSSTDEFGRSVGLVKSIHVQ